MRLTIRQASREDLPYVLDLYRELETDKSAVLSEDRANEIFDKMALYPNYKLYVAVMDNLAHMGAPSGLIEDVVVKSNWQNKGAAGRAAVIKPPCQAIRKG